MVFFAEKFECELDTLVSFKAVVQRTVSVWCQRIVTANRTELFSAGWEAETSASHGVSGQYSLF